MPLPTVPQGRNGVREFIPVARIADMLLQPGTPFEYNGRQLQLSRYPPGLLGRRQPVPPSSGPQPPAPCLRAARHAGGARKRLDRDGTPRRYRAALHDVAGAQRHRREFRRRSADGGDAPRRSAVRRGAGRLCDLCCPGRTARAGGGVHRGTRRGRLAAPSLCAHAIRLGRSCGTTHRISTRSGSAANWNCRCSRMMAASLRAFRRDPEAHPLPTPSGRIEIASETIAGFRL